MLKGMYSGYSFEGDKIEEDSSCEVIQKFRHYNIYQT